MHIYIQRGGRRPSHSSTNLIKSLSLQSLEDASPRFREKVLEYDKKRREQDKLKPKPKPLPLPNANSPPKRERKKYVPNFETKRPLKKSTSVVIPNQDEKPMIVEHGSIFSEFLSNRNQKHGINNKTKALYLNS